MSHFGNVGTTSAEDRGVNINHPVPLPNKCYSKSLEQEIDGSSLFNSNTNNTKLSELIYSQSRRVNKVSVCIAE